MDRLLRSERVALVVDDDVFVLSALAELLSEDGYDVHTASNGFSGVRLAIECRPVVILLDLALPERSGSEVLAELRGHPTTRDAAIVVVTSSPHLLTAAQVAETDGVVGKPFDIDELMATVQRAAHRAALRHAEVIPVAPISRSAVAARQRRAPGVRHSRGRR